MSMLGFPAGRPAGRFNNSIRILLELVEGVQDISVGQGHRWITVLGVYSLLAGEDTTWAKGYWRRLADLSEL